MPTTLSAPCWSTATCLLAGKSDALYEFNGTALTRTVAPPAKPSGTFLLPLPSGQVLVLTPGSDRYAPGSTRRRRTAGRLGADHHHSPDSRHARPDLCADRNPAQRPQRSRRLMATNSTSATNYPLVRITNVATGHVFYARTHGHPMGVATGGALVTTISMCRPNAETGASQLVVVANGIASATGERHGQLDFSGPARPGSRGWARSAPDVERQIVADDEQRHELERDQQDDRRPDRQLARERGSPAPSSAMSDSELMTLSPV